MPREPITNKDLEGLVKTINEITNSPTEGYKPNQYMLDGAYGGWKLVRKCADNTGIHEITSGYVSKRDLYNRLQAILIGLRMSKGE